MVGLYTGGRGGLIVGGGAYSRRFTVYDYMIVVKSKFINLSKPLSKFI